MILPKTNEYLRRTVSLRPNLKLKNGDLLPYEIEFGITRMLQEELIGAKNCEAIRIDLLGCHDFSPLALFKIIDNKKLGYLDSEE